MTTLDNLAMALRDAALAEAGARLGDKRTAKLIRTTIDYDFRGTWNGSAFREDGEIKKLHDVPEQPAILWRANQRAWKACTEIVNGRKLVE